MRAAPATEQAEPTETEAMAAGRGPDFTKARPAAGNRPDVDERIVAERTVQREADEPAGGAEAGTEARDLRPIGVDLDEQPVRTDVADRLVSRADEVEPDQGAEPEATDEDASEESIAAAEQAIDEAADAAGDAMDDAMDDATDDVVAEPVAGSESSPPPIVKAINETLEGIQDAAHVDVGATVGGATASASIGLLGPRDIEVDLDGDGEDDLGPYVQSKVEHVRGAIDDGVAAAGQAYEDTTGAINEGVAAAGQAVADTQAAIGEQYEQGAEATQQFFDDAHEAAHVDVDATLGQGSASASVGLGGIRDLFIDLDGDGKDDIEQAGENAQSQYDENTQAFGRFIDDGMAAAGQAYEDTTGAIGDGVNATGDFIKNGMNTAGQTIEDGLNAAGDAIEDGMNSAGQGINDGLDAAGEAVGGFVDFLTGDSDDDSDDDDGDDDLWSLFGW